jgi:hypothetical protein
LADVVSDGAAAEVCSGENAARLANDATRDSAQKIRQLRTAAGHSRRAAALASKVSLKVAALKLLVGTYDTQHLDDPKQMEAVLRERNVLTPDNLDPVFLPAKVQEDEGLIDAAEVTVLDAPHRQPDAVEPNRMLAQFYARRVTALRKQETDRQLTDGAAELGQLATMDETKTCDCHR